MHQFVHGVLQAIRDKVAQTRDLQAQPDRCAEVDADIAKCHAQCAELKAGMVDLEVHACLLLSSISNTPIHLHFYKRMAAMHAGAFE